MCARHAFVGLKPTPFGSTIFEDSGRQQGCSMLCAPKKICMLPKCQDQQTAARLSGHNRYNQSDDQQLR